jgi:serine/threonine protein kinase
MATVHLGRVRGSAKPVAIKRLHAQFAKDPQFAAMFFDEARLAVHIRHPNVVELLDFVAVDGELFLVLEYVEGVSLAHLLRGAPGPMAPALAARVAVDLLEGLSAAHAACNEKGERLDIVHRDVSPQNVLVGADGRARVLDFGVAKAAGRLQTTRDGQLKGKMAYMAPEQLTGGQVDARTDLYSAGVVLWEALTGRPLFVGDNDGMVLARVLAGGAQPPSRVVPSIPHELDDVVMRALEGESADRFASAREMAEAVARAFTPATHGAVAALVSKVASARLSERIEALKTMVATSPQPVRAATPGRLRSTLLAAFVLAFAGAGWLAAFGMSRTGRVEPAPKPAAPVAAAVTVVVEPPPSPPSPAEVAAVPPPPAAHKSRPPAARSRGAAPEAAPKSCAPVTYDADGKAKVHPECL